MMASDILNLFAESFSASGSWFGSLFENSGLTGTYMALLFVLMVVRFLLSPLFGAGSDRASNKASRKGGI